MNPLHVLTSSEHDALRTLLLSVDASPYRDYAAFSRQVSLLVACNDLPRFFKAVCEQIRDERTRGVGDIHLLRHCPIDQQLPRLDLDDPVIDKYARKKTFVGETLLALVARLTDTPLLSYGSRNNGDFFTDVIAINRYSGQQTGFSDSELVFHNDRTAHVVRADYIALLGLRCPKHDLVYTGFISGRDLVAALPEPAQTALRQAWYVTPFDVYSRDTNARQVVSEHHSVLENEHSFRYLDATTAVATGAPEAAKDALIALHVAVTRAPRTRHRLVDGDLLLLANQDGLHNREKIEINDPAGTRARWLLKTYAFRDSLAASRHAHRWVDGAHGRLAD